MENKKDLIYFAGYTDGDGCFSITCNKKKFRTTFCITTTNFEIVSYLVQNFCGHCNKSNPPTNQKPVFQFRKYGKDALDFANCIAPYLVQRKQECALFKVFFDKISKKDKLDIIQQLSEERAGNHVSIADLNSLRIIKTISPTEEDFIYMAGFIDAECSFTISKHKPNNRPNHVYKILLQLNDTKSPMFFWIKARFGGFCCWFKRKHPNKDQITWRLTGKSLYPFLKNVYPYLRFKKPVCEQLIEFYETTLDNGGARHTEDFRTSYAQTIAKRESIIQQVHFLNKKGL